MFKHQKSIQNIYIAVIINPETGERKDIIHFYNEVYIKVMKEYIIQSKGEISKTPMPVINSCLTPG